MRLLAALSLILPIAACDTGSGVYRDLTGDLTCPNLSAVAQPLIVGTERYPVRCGPQTQRPY